MAEKYGTFGQIRGNQFKGGQNIIDLIYLEEGQYVSDIAVHTYEGTTIELNGNDIYFDNLTDLHFSDIEVKSLTFPKKDINDKYPEDVFVIFGIREKGE